MISASQEFIQALNDNHNFKVRINATLTDGTQLIIQNPNIRMDSLSFEKAVSGDSTFDIGSFIVGKLSLTLNNIPGTYNGMDFDGAVLTLSFANNLSGALYPSNTLYPGTNLYPGQITTQYVQIGTYTVVDTDGQNGAWISLVAYDNANKFLAPLSGANVTFPTTASSLVSAICSYVGVSVSTIPSALASITIPALGDGLTPNCLQAIAWCAMLCGKNATINPIGQLVFTWYDTATLASVRSDVETNGWDDADLSAIHEMTGLIDVRTTVEDVTITGVTVTYQNTDGEDVTTPISGSSGYVINVAENAFVNENNVTAVLTNLTSALVGMTFRPFDITMMPNPLWEPGDIVYFHNRKGQYFLSVLTSMSLPMGNHMTVLCGAEAPVKQSAMDYSATTRVIQQTRAVAQRALNTANSAAEVAEATAQYFWHDTNGVHVADEEGNATATRNTLWNSLGMLFRKGANVLLGILTGSTPQVAIYDGIGNTDDHIVASFSANGVVVGLADSIHSTMEADGFGVAYGPDKLFDVTTNGYFTNVYMGGSTLATGVKYTNVQVSETINFLNSGCTVSGTDVLDPNGDATGYTISTEGGIDFVLDADGEQFESAGYSGIYYYNGLFEGDVSLDPLTEVDTAQAVISMGGVGVSAYDKNLDVVTKKLAIKKNAEDPNADDFVFENQAIRIGQFYNTYDDLWYRANIQATEDGRTAYFTFNSGASWGTQLGIGNYDRAGGTLYTGRTNIDDIGDGTITGAIKALVPDISKQSGSTTSVATGTNTTIKSVSLKAGRYLLIGSGSFPAGTGRCNLHFSMTGDSSEADKYASVAVPLASGGVTRPQVMWTTTISTDGTSVYLVAYHTSGSTVSVSSVGIQVIPLDGGGIYS